MQGRASRKMKQCPHWLPSPFHVDVDYDGVPNIRGGNPMTHRTLKMAIAVIAVTACVYGPCEADDRCSKLVSSFVNEVSNIYDTARTKTLINQRLSSLQAKYAKQLDREVLDELKKYADVIFNGPTLKVPEGENVKEILMSWAAKHEERAKRRCLELSHKK